MIDLEDPGVQRIVRAIARAMVRTWPGVEVEELAAEGYLRLLTTPRRFDPAKGDWPGWVRRIAGEGMRMYLRRKRTRDMAPIESDFPVRDCPEPSPELVWLFGLLSDDEADTLCFACGMDGAAERGNIMVATILGCSPARVFRLRHSALAKIRERIEAMQQAASA